MSPPHEYPHRLAYFPVALFTSVMGMVGLAIAWFKAAHLGWVSPDSGYILRGLASGLLLILGVIYVTKWLRYPEAVQAEYQHPMKQTFFCAISISFILLSIAWIPDAPDVACWLWRIGTALHLALTVSIISGWIHHTHWQINHISPTWFIPIGGNLLIPVAGVYCAPADISWFFFSVGLVFWLILLTLVFYRLFFHEQLPQRLTPTLFILLAPPSIGFMGYVSLTHNVDAFARMLYFIALFLALLLASNALRFFRVPFFMSSWAYSFPLAALTLATFEMAAHSHAIFYQGLSGILLVLLSVLILWLTLKTLRAAYAGTICVPDA